MNKYTERLYNGIWKENPIFVQMLGLCPTLAVTTSAMKVLVWDFSSTVVLVSSKLYYLPDEKHHPGKSPSSR